MKKDDYKYFKRRITLYIVNVESYILCLRLHATSKALSRLKT